MEIQWLVCATVVASQQKPPRGKGYMNTLQALQQRLPHHVARRLLASAAALALLAVALPAPAQLKYIETKELKVVYYDPATAFLAPSAARSFLDALDADKALFGFQPDGQVNVLLSDFSDGSDATTTTAPRNQVFYEVSVPDEPYESLTPADNFTSTAAHETLHVVFNDGASAADRRFRSLFRGKVIPDAQHPESLLYYYLTSPRSTAPRWYQEGAAVFMETWQMGGTGRAWGGFDEMVFRGMVNEGVPFYDPLGLVSKGTEVDFRSGANAYLYGTRFMNYLALTYGPEKLLAWLTRKDGTQRYYADQFQQVYGLPLEQSWQNWVRFEHEFQQKNLAAAKEHPITPYQDVTQQLLGSVSRTFVSADGTKVYAAIKFPGQVSQLVAIARQNGKVTNLLEVKGPSGLRVASLAYDAANETLFFTSNNNTYRNLEALDLRTGKVSLLAAGARIGDLAFNAADRSLWGLRHNRGFAMLVRLPYPYREWKTVSVFRYPEAPSDLDVSADGTLVSVSVSRPGSTPTTRPVSEVRVMSVAALEKGDATPVHRLHLDGATPEGFVFSPDGRYLFGSSYYTGVSNIYRYELANEALEAVSNTAIGFFRPQVLTNDQLLVLRYSGTGFVPTVIDAKPTEDMSAITFLGEQVSSQHPVVQSWGISSTAPSSAYDARVIGKGDYRPLHELRLNYLIPGIAAYKNAKAVGFNAAFGDPMGLDWLKTDLSYSPGTAVRVKERLHFNADLHHGNWTTGVKWNAADFYDLFGPTKLAREGYSVYLNYDRPLVYDPPETLNFVVNLAYYGGLDALPGSQTIASPSHLSALDVGLVSVDTRSSEGAVDNEAGHSWSLMAHTLGARGDLTASISGQYDVGFSLPINHSSLWLRSGFSVSDGHVDSPLSNAYVGSFGNNYVDNAANGGAQRYRDMLSMPGFDIDALSGKTLVKTMLEWSLPPLRFDALGSPGAYLSWMRPEIFASTMVTNVQDANLRQHASNVGVQLDFQLQVMHRLPMMFSVGFARGFGGGGLGKNEFMISFQVL